MKFAAFLIASLTFFLAMEPGIKPVMSLVDTGCCSSEHCTAASSNTASNKNESDGNCYGGNVCNPFLSCCACTGYFTSLTSFQVFLTTSPAEKISSYKSVYFSQFSPDFWQPPKIG